MELNIIYHFYILRINNLDATRFLLDYMTWPYVDVARSFAVVINQMMHSFRSYKGTNTIRS